MAAIFKDFKDLREYLSSLSDWMVKFHERIQCDIQQHTGNIPPIADPERIKRRTELRMKQLSATDWYREEIKAVHVQQQAILETPQEAIPSPDEVRQHFSELLRESQERAAKVHREQFLEAPTLRIDLSPEERRSLDAALDTPIDEEETQIRPAIIPLTWQCTRTEHEEYDKYYAIGRHFKRCVALFTSMYDREPEYIEVSREDNNELTVILGNTHLHTGLDPELGKYLRRENATLKPRTMIAVGSFKPK